MRLRDNKERTSKPVSMKGAAFVQLFSKMVAVLIQLIISAILARLISPGEFGSVAIVAVFIALFQMFSDMGISTAIVQFRDLTDEDYGSLFGFSCLLAAFLGALLFSFAPMVAWLYSDDALIFLMHCSVAVLVLTTLNTVPNGLMLKAKRFVSIGVRLIIATVVSGVLGVVLAIYGFGAFALVAQSAVSSFIVLIWNLASNPLKGINLHFAKPLRKILSYSSYQFGFTVINYLNRNLDNLVIGRAIGTVALGYYDKGYSLARYPVATISSVVASVIQPYMAEYQNDLNRIFKCWIEVAKIMSLIGVVISAIFFCCSDEIIRIVFGSQWGSSVPVFRALAISTYAQMQLNIAGGFYQSAGRTDLMFKAAIVNTALTITGLIVGLIFGDITIVAVCVSIAFCAEIGVVLYYLGYRCFRVTPRQYVPLFAPELALLFVACMVCNALFSLVTFNPILMLLAKSSIITAIFGAGFILFKQTGYLKSLLIKRQN